MYINLKSALLLRQVRQFDLARQLEVSESYMSLVITGRREPSPELRRKAAEILQCDQTWLFARPRTIPVRADRAEIGGAA